MAAMPILSHPNTQESMKDRHKCTTCFQCLRKHSGHTSRAQPGLPKASTIIAVPLGLSTAERRSLHDERLLCLPYSHQEASAILLLIVQFYAFRRGLLLLKPLGIAPLCPLSEPNLGLPMRHAAHKSGSWRPSLVVRLLHNLHGANLCAMATSRNKPRQQQGIGSSAMAWARPGGKPLTFTA